MYRCLNAGNVGVSLNWEACLPLAKPAGFTGIDVPVTPDTDCAKTRDLLNQYGLKAGGQALPCDFRGTDAVGSNAGLLLDSWHWHTSLGTVDEIRALKNGQVVAVDSNRWRGMNRR